MGQKTHPTGFRLGVIRDWDSRWFTKRSYADLLEEDLMIRRYLRERLSRAAVSKIEIERAVKRVTVTIKTARPGVVIGRKGVEVDRLRDELKHITGKDVFINIEEVKTPEVDAELVAQSIARQLEQRVSYRRAMKRAVVSAMRMGAQGIKVSCAGRLAGAEIARREGYREGRVPLQTIRADVEYATALARTTYGCIGVKVWIFKGEVLSKRAEASATGQEG
ncbi:30S ribosomal protein S3 [candidate division TA06 bacterium DG_24]|uniref:Small ribosomal subunit protein uS3 n=3 Tax=Bacteria division TA06 TaxID=1156500 RepID=A0A0S8JLK5_UNCT6|nr:MAG: 30S ribosomal protein S3 [candidate division TA06 bacterium DG_24]KPK70908.1 MAG: 30S ribosomal protein S3 [candidate division TA06 bacterium SM23_40]KPL09582.1 MAG: 30S ribosomal protein S3 [candidate division TA06 bacterium SM1_40]